MKKIDSIMQSITNWLLGGNLERLVQAIGGE